ncbi:MAG: hypothetical protein LBQ31_00495 [Bacteroidales bacterium]|nr:hypothetical protein [Bacteroidales bacterium]
MACPFVTHHNHRQKPPADPHPTSPVRTLQKAHNEHYSHHNTGQTNNPTSIKTNKRSGYRCYLLPVRKTKPNPKIPQQTPHHPPPQNPPSARKSEHPAPNPPTPLSH